MGAQRKEENWEKRGKIPQDPVDPRTPETLMEELGPLGIWGKRRNFEIMGKRMKNP